jgi:phospholipase/carboxylesterase
MPPDRIAETPAETRGRLNARPITPASTGPAGLHPLEIAGGRDGYVYVPAGYRPESQAPLVLMLHGAGGKGSDNIQTLLPYADDAGMILVSPDSRLQTWDVLHGAYGPDIAYIDQALQQTFDRYSVDPSRIGIEGFSDGASYALSVGITNGDLFTNILAFSPGFMAPAGQTGAPRIFISHGTRDATLPIDRCSRRIVPQLQQAGYDVTYIEFDGPHTVPSTIAEDAVTWFLAGE